MGSPHKENINMATRMQQRRGTAAQWTAANPILAAGEIGFETDTNKFKMGNGSSTWTALQYFANAAELAAIIDGAPELLNTLNELAASIGDDPTFFTSVASNLSAHSSDTTSVHGIANTANLATTADTTTAIQVAVTDHNATTGVHGIADTSELETQTGAQAKADAALLAAEESTDTKLSLHAADTTSVHGITDTSALETTTGAQEKADAAVLAHSSLTENVHGISDTANLVYTADLNAHTGDNTNVHGIADTADLVTTAMLSDHADVTVNVHGIVDTSLLVTTEMLADAVTPSSLGYAGLAGTGLDYDPATDELNIDSTVATKTYADDAVSTHNSNTTNVHGIADTSLLATTADVAAVTKTTLGLGNVDNTSDADKPVSTATVTAIATAKSEAIAEVTAVIDGAPNALNTLNELAAALGDDANFASTVTTSLAAKVDSYTPITQKTASYTLSTLDHRDDLIEMNSASALTLTIPLNSSIAYPVGTSLDILQTGAGQVTIAGAAGVTVNATPGLKLRTQWSSATLFKRAENTWVVYGDLTA